MIWYRSLIVVLLTALSATAGDSWPQWLGPQRDGTSAEKIAPWKQAPPVRWSVPVGEGHSSPIVADGKVFLHTKVAGQDKEQVSAYETMTGKEIWSKTYARGPLHAKFIKQFGVGPRGTPAYHDGRLYTFGVTGVLICFKASDGEILWQVDTTRQFSPSPLTFGVSCSPLIVDDKVLLNVGGKGASLVAFQAKTGEVVWKTLNDPPSYSSPIVFGEGNKRQVVFLTEEGLVSVNPVDGQKFWNIPLKDKLSESSTTPVRSGDWLLGSSVTFGSLGIQLKDTTPPSAEQKWKEAKLSCWFSTPTLIDDEHAYLVTGQVGLLAPPSCTLRCVNIRSGKELWNRPNVGRYHASLLRLGDEKLLMLDDNGGLKLIDASLKGYSELCSAKVLGETWAHPALANGFLYVRDDKVMKCLQLK